MDLFGVKIFGRNDKRFGFKVFIALLVLPIIVFVPMEYYLSGLLFIPDFLLIDDSLLVFFVRQTTWLIYPIMLTFFFVVVRKLWRVIL